MVDTSLIIPLAKADQIAVLSKAKSYAFYITPVVRGEIQSPEAKNRVDQGMVQGALAPIELDTEDTEFATRFASWSEKVDPGEAEAIACAQARGWLVALEDRAAQRKLNAEHGPGAWINIADILLDCVRSGTLTLAQADEVFKGLSVYKGYALRGVVSLKHFLE